MADLTIPDYTAASGIDAASDYLLIYNAGASAYRKINRNTLLSVSGTPADLSTAQTFTNKVLGVTNTVTLLDTLFTLQDNSDNTKQAQFQLSGITTGTTRTYTLPNASSTLMDLGSAQTVTGVKTMTAPVISGGSIANSTITVDAIGEYTAANGVTVDGMNIKDGKLNTNNSVVTANITDTAITPAKLQAGTGTGWAYSSWTPTWTNLTIGNATVVGKYIQIGKTVIAHLSVILGGTSAVTGAVSFTLPITASAAYTGGDPLGYGNIFDSGTAIFQAAVLWGSATTCSLEVWGSAGTYVNDVVISNTVPMAWTNGDRIGITLHYEAA